MKLKIKPLLLCPIDIIIIFSAYIVSFLAFSSGTDGLGGAYAVSIALFTGIYILFYLIFDMYFTVLEHVSFGDMVKYIFANCVSMVVIFVFNALFIQNILPHLEMIQNTVIVFAGLLIMILTTGLRALPRAITIYGNQLANDRRKGRSVKNVLIYGAGNAGNMLLRDISNNPGMGYRVVAFYDDSYSKAGNKLNGVRVYGPKIELTKIVETLNIQIIIIAVPSASEDAQGEIIKRCNKTGCKLKILPGLYDMVVNEKDLHKLVRDVDVKDLLHRKESKIDIDSISLYLKDEVVLVTGAGGSIGSELCRQIMKFSPKKLILFDIYENNVFELAYDLRNLYGKEAVFETFIGSVRDYDRLNDLFKREQPKVVFHAAAHKHVPLMEDSPCEAVKNNVLGTYNVIKASDANAVKTFVLISTDKAVNPTNVMGATKRMAEMILQSFCKTSSTRYVAVRFGNVLNSNGSVIPTFEKQIAKGGPVTVTHPEITRFFMTIPEAARLVIQAGAMAKGGEIFILDMGKPVKIVDLARDMIRLSGFTPDVDIKIDFTGLRPGEKLYEELLQAEEGTTQSSRDGIFVAKPFEKPWSEVSGMIDELMSVAEKNDVASMVECLQKHVTTFHPANNK